MRRLKRKRQRHDGRPTSASNDDLATTLALALRRHWELIESIMDTGALACVVAEAMTPSHRRAARELGWDEHTPVFAASRAGARRFAERVRQNVSDDAGMASWLEAERDGRLIVFIRGGCILLNYSRENGLSVQPFPEPIG